ncbi:MAG: site-specific DNA-methyltransferase [Acidobacteriaceae bacterium]|nr:site-specific DNA-methyltransferase [Acidobacteriaceae bacterium]
MSGRQTHTEVNTVDVEASFRQQPAYRTALGTAFLGDSEKLLARLPAGSTNLVFTSPPYALHFKKEYGNAHKRDYVKWFIPFAKQIWRILRDDGSFVLNIGGSYNEGTPTRSLYHFHLLIALVEHVGFQLAQECFWYNPAKMPMPAEWVTVRRIRIKDSVEYVWWLSKTPWPKANNIRVLKEYSPDMIRLSRRGVRPAVRPSGHVIRDSFDKVEAGGAIPANVIEDEPLEGLDIPIPEAMLKFGNNAANDAYAKRSKELGLKMHPARFPAALPEFFIKLLTDEGDTVVDPFAGSNTTGVVAEGLRRRWIAMERIPEYLEASKVRFGRPSNSAVASNGSVQTELF